MKKFIVLFTILAATVSIIILSNYFDDNTDNELTEKIMNSNYSSEYAELTKKLLHYSSSSTDAIKIIERIEKIKSKVSGEVKADKPDEFARILSEMKIAYGEEIPSYPINYKFEELKKAKDRLELNGKTSSTLPWMERGPGNVAGRARGLIVDPDDAAGNTWYVGSVGGGIWKTTNAGSEWNNLTPNLPNLAVSTIAMAESNHDIIYAGTGESFFSVDVINGDGMLKSTDRGATWTQLSSTVNNYDFNNIARILVDPSDENTLLAAVTTGRYNLSFSNKSGIFKSTDGGTTWNNVYNETELGGFGRVKKVLHIVATPGDFNILYGGIDEKGVIKSTDAGDTWFNSSIGITDASGRFELAISPSTPTKIFAAAEGSPNSNLYVSTDAGDNWIRTTESGSEPNWLGAQGWYDNTIIVHPTNDNIVYVGGVRLYQITVSGSSRSTSQLSTGPVHVDHHNLVIIPGSGSSFRILNANDGGIGVSGSGASNWTKPTLGMITAQFYGVDKMPGGSAYAGGMQDNGTWRSDLGPGILSQWNFQIGGDGYEVSWHFNDPQKIIGGSQYNGLARSTDGGFSFSNATNGLGDTGGGNAPFITKIAKSNMEPDLLFAVGAQGVWKSTNFGASWSLRSIPFSDWGSVSSFHDVKISRANPNIVWAGRRMDPSGKINVSTDTGESFSATPVYDVRTMGSISGLSTHPLEDSTAYVLFSFAQMPKVLKTTDLGQTWDDISGFGNGSVSTNGFPDVAVYDLLVFPHSPDTMWAGTEIGLFESTDAGTSWHAADNGLPNVAIWAMTHVEDEVVIASHGRGIWSVEIPGMSDAQAFNPLLKGLSQRSDGTLLIDLNLRSIYDSSLVNVNGNLFMKIDANSSSLIDTLIEYPVTMAEVLDVQILSYKDEVEYPSIEKSIDVIPYQAAQLYYYNDFNSATNDFVGSGFSIQNVSGFDDEAIHTPHFYTNNQNSTYMLTVPIIVAAQEAFISFDNVALIESGEPGTVFGDDSFWDYVIVEGTKDGLNWVALADGYDARLHNDWLNAYNGGQAGNQSLYKNTTYNLLDTFEADDEILIRFRLFADAAAVGWGWAIDNLQIQPIINDVDDFEIPTAFSLEQNYPNPFNPSTTIQYSLPSTGHVSIKIFDTIGREVTTLINEVKNAGSYNIEFNASNISSGIYYYRIESADFVDVKKMVLLK